MKVILATLFLVFISTSFALGVPKRFGKQISIHSLHLEKISSLGSALKGLIQLAEVQELVPVVEAIQGVSNEITAILNSNEQGLAVLTEKYEEARQNAEDVIESYQESLEASQQALVVAEQQETDLEGAIENNNNAINEDTERTNAEVARRQANQEANAESVANINEALQALADAEELLEEIRGLDLTAGSSFVQVHKKKFAKALSLVQTKMSKTKLKTTSTHVYIKQLVQIAQDVEAQATVNSDILDLISVLVDNIQKELGDERDQVIAADAADQEASDAVLANLAATLENSRNQLAQNQALLADTQANIENLESTIASTEDSLQSAEEHLETVESDYASQSQTLKGYIERLQLDLDVLQRAVVFVQSQFNEANEESSAVSENPPSVVADDFGLPQPEEAAPVIVGDDPRTWGPPLQEEAAPEPAAVQEEAAGDVDAGVAEEVQAAPAAVEESDESEESEESEDEEVQAAASVAAESDESEESEDEEVQATASVAAESDESDESEESDE